MNVLNVSLRDCFGVASGESQRQVAGRGAALAGGRLRAAAQTSPKHTFSFGFPTRVVCVCVCVCVCVFVLFQGARQWC